MNWTSKELYKLTFKWKNLSFFKIPAKFFSNTKEEGPKAMALRFEKKRSFFRVFKKKPYEWRPQIRFSSKATERSCFLNKKNKQGWVNKSLTTPRTQLYLDNHYDILNYEIENQYEWQSSSDSSSSE